MKGIQEGANRVNFSLICANLHYLLSIITLPITILNKFQFQAYTHGSATVRMYMYCGTGPLHLLSTDALGGYAPSYGELPRA